MDVMSINTHSFYLSHVQPGEISTQITSREIHRVPDMGTIS